MLELDDESKIIKSY